MYTIQISVRDKIATQTDDTVIINGNSDYSIEFDFDAEWANLNNKIGIFAYNDAAAHKWSYQTVMFSGNTCTVPILRDIHCVYVGVTAGNVRVTTPAKVQCRLSISDYADAEEPPSADIWGQILAKLDELQTEIDAVTATANEAVLYTPQMLDNLQKQQAQKNIGINPEGRTTSMTNPVGVDGYGKLWSKADTSLNVIGATVGQTIKVKTVDDDGKPTAWEAVDMEAGADGITPTIGENGNWYLGETDTGKPSRGVKGDKGDTGATGESGADGADGKSAYQIAIDNGFVGSQSEWLASLKGDKGEKGDTGEQGLQGEQGIQGIQGAKGDKGDTGAPGKDGKTPVKGTDYWTAADKQEIVNSVIDALPDGTEVSY